MSAALDSDAIDRDTRSPAVPGAADWLGLAAAPTFAVMALLSVLGGWKMAAMCSAPQDASMLSGMVPMYLLMGVFHSGPWLKLIANRRSGARSQREAPESVATR